MTFDAANSRFGPETFKKMSIWVKKTTIALSYSFLDFVNSSSSLSNSISKKIRL